MLDIPLPSNGGGLLLILLIALLLTMHATKGHRP